MSVVDLHVINRGRAYNMKSIRIQDIEKALDRVESDAAKVVEITGRSGYCYDFPKTTKSMTPHLVYSAVNGVGYRMGKWNTASNPNTYILATHVLRSCWYPTTAPDCSNDHKRRQAGHVCESFAIVSGPLATSFDQTRIQRLNERLAALTPGIANNPPPRESRAQATQRWEARATGETNDVGQPMETSVGEPAETPPDPAGLHSITELQPDAIAEMPQDQAFDAPVNFEDPALREAPARPVPPDPAPDFTAFKDALEQLHLGGEGAQVFLVVRETWKAGGVLTRECLLSKGIPTDSHAALHRIHTKAEQVASGSYPNLHLTPESVSRWYKENPLGGGCHEVLLGLHPANLPPLVRGSSEYQRWRQRFYDVLKTDAFKQLLNGYDFKPVPRTLKDGTVVGEVLNGVGDTIWAATRVV